MVRFLWLVLAAAAAFKLDPAPGVSLRFSPAMLADAPVFFYSTYPPIDDIVIQNFHFRTSSPLILDLMDAFCTGNRYEIYDNFQLIASGEDILNFCGISTGSLGSIASPSFTHLELYLDAGEHQLDVVIFHSPIGGQKTSMRITLKPLGEGCVVDVLGMDELKFAYPPGFKPGDFKLADYVKNERGLR